MSRAKLFNLIKSRGEQKNGRNPFDLTNRHIYTQKAGKITPVKVVHTYPDDYFEVDMSEFSQNNIPMNTAAFLAGKKELIAYFVPYNSIWHNFNQFMATREDPDSVLLQQKGISFEPRMSLYSLYSAALFFFIHKWFMVNFKELNAVRSFINGGLFNDTLHDGMTGEEVLAMSQSTMVGDDKQVSYYDDYVRSYTYWLMQHLKFSDHRANYNINFNCFEYASGTDNDILLSEVVADFNQNFIWCDFVQKLDMFGYGNIYPVLYNLQNELDSAQDLILKHSRVVHTDDGFQLQYLYGGSTIIVTGDDFDYELSQDIPVFDAIIERFRLELYGMSTYLDGEIVKPEYVNVYPIYGYNKIFYSYMRNVYFDTGYDVRNYNCDFVNAKTLEGSIITYEYIPARWYRLETHQWKKDMFTGILPDNQLGQVSSLILGSAESQTLSLPVDGYGTLVPENNVVISDPVYPDDAISSAERRGSSQTYGVYPLYSHGAGSVAMATSTSGSVASQDSLIKSPHTHNLQRYGDNDNIYVGLNARATGDVQLGNVELNVLALKRAEAIQQYRQDLMRAGNRTKDVFEQIFGTNPKSEMDETPYFIDVASNDINVNAIIASAETGQEINGKLGDIAARSTIAGQSLHFKFSTKDFGMIIFLSYIVPESFYNSYRLDPFVTHLDQEAHGLPYFQNLGLQPVLREYLANNKSASLRQSTVGFAPPYIERKTDIDLVHGNLVDVAEPHRGLTSMEYQGSLSHWAVARTDMQAEQTVTLRQFYINPRILDNVFTFNAGDDYETDHYLTYATIKIEATRAFSQLGLPRF